MSTSAKRRTKCNRSYSVTDKLSAIARVRSGLSKAKVSRDIDVPESTMRGWFKEEEKLVAYASKADGHDPLRMKRVRLFHETIDDSPVYDKVLKLKRCLSEDSVDKLEDCLQVEESGMLSNDEDCGTNSPSFTNHVDTYLCKEIPLTKSEMWDFSETSYDGFDLEYYLPFNDYALKDQSLVYGYTADIRDPADNGDVPQYYELRPLTL